MYSDGANKRRGIRGLGELSQSLIWRRFHGIRFGNVTRLGLAERERESAETEITQSEEQEATEKEIKRIENQQRRP